MWNQEKIREKRTRHTFTQEQLAFIGRNAPLFPDKITTEMFNLKFGLNIHPSTIQNIRDKKLGIKRAKPMNPPAENIKRGKRTALNLVPGNYYKIMILHQKQGDKGKRTQAEKSWREYIYIKSTKRLAVFMRQKSEALECFKLHDLLYGIVKISPMN